MAGVFDALITPDPKQVDPQGRPGFTDYVTDIPVGVLKGASRTIQGLISLGAMPIDYLANTNLLSAIDEIFDKITPETETALGDIVSIVTQFGVPAAGAVKIANGIMNLNKASRITKLSSIPTVSGKATELATRS